MLELYKNKRLYKNKYKLDLDLQEGGVLLILFYLGLLLLVEGLDYLYLYSQHWVDLQEEDVEEREDRKRLLQV